MGIKVAGAAGGYLDSRYTLRTNTFGIVLGFEIALDDGQAYFITYGFNRRLEQCCLASTWR
jgi:hypothetical protein